MYLIIRNRNTIENKFNTKYNFLELIFFIKSKEGGGGNSSRKRKGHL